MDGLDESLVYDTKRIYLQLEMLYNSGSVELQK